ncbi:MAG: aquaporin family protein [Actinobacteria bacterium]|nr:aquaporin family protein [Actinomycetota bacterium]
MDSTFLSEMMGTGLLILLGDGVVAAVLLNKSKAQNSGWIVITFGWAIAVMIGVFAATKSGAHLNPAVTFGQAAAGDLEWSKVPEYVGGQFAGAAIGALLVWMAYYVHWGETEDPGLKLAVFSTGPAIRNTMANLITEIIGTFVLVFGVYAIFKVGGVADGTLSAGLGPLLVALLVLGIGLSLGGPTGYAINPARDLGPRIMHAILPIAGKGGSDWSYSWIPVVGPLIGGAIGGIVGAAAFGHF